MQQTKPDDYLITNTNNDNESDIIEVVVQDQDLITGIFNLSTLFTILMALVPVRLVFLFVTFLTRFDAFRLP